MDDEPTPSTPADGPAPSNEAPQAPADEGFVPARPTSPLGAAFPDLPPGPGVPSEPPPPRRRGRLWLIIGAGIVALLVVVAVLATRGGGSSDLPEEVLGLPRIHSDQMQAFEDAMASLRIGDLEITVAAYGQADQAEILVASYANLPGDAASTMEGLMRGAVGGGSASGGSFDSDAQITQTRDGVEYRCLPFSGQLFPTSPSQEGVICAWPQGPHDAVLLMDVQTHDPQVGLEHAVAVHDAIS